MKTQNWRHYLPALIAFMGALFMLVVPVLAVFLVVGALVTFGLFYASIIYKMHQLQRHARQQSSEIDASAPNFREVTFRMSRQMGISRDVN